MIIHHSVCFFFYKKQNWEQTVIIPVGPPSPWRRTAGRRWMLRRTPVITNFAGRADRDDTKGISSADYSPPTLYFFRSLAPLVC